MLGLILLLGFIFVAVRVVKAVRGESAIFKEFAQPITLAFLVFLLPVGPIALLVLPHRVGWLPAAVLGAACYLPALISSRRLVSAFDRSGTDRTAVALKTAHEAFGAALVGIIYVSVFVVLSAGVSSVGGSGS